ncbi:hypothetical protein [Halomarina oriensis]|uniref:Uncharacterized protein n=1 Tax=Halomarina oriensis TaxID=671145 RepID=A0A6B0GMA1_9EURY|nr:hypothetical protein [Halomarina oriensis]MWG34807.1 hypothetical protein [Halomarina oriensis]
MTVEDLVTTAAARLAANNHPDVRWHDSETGREHYASPVGVMDLLDAGADPDDVDAVRLVSRVEVKPYDGPPVDYEWLGSVTRTQLRVMRNGDVVRGLATGEARQSDRFVGRSAAVEFCEREAEAFRDAEVREVER